jgi:hypothetical protein
MHDIHDGLTPDELAKQEAADLPDREAMTLIDPGTALGSGIGAPPLGGTDTGTVPTDSGTVTPSGSPAPSLTLPKLPPLPVHNAGESYNPDAAASSQT